MWKRRPSKKGIPVTSGIYKGFKLLGPYMSSDGGRMEYRLLDYHNPGKPWSVSVHRFVMEQHLGRFLDKWEMVYHKDGNRSNNHLDNLEVITKSEWSRRKKMVDNLRK